MVNIYTQTIETERLILRKFTYDDARDMLCYWASDPLVQSLYREPTYTTKDDITNLLHQYITSYEKPDYYRWAIILKDTNECIGQIAYFLVNSKDNFGEIEYCIGRSFQGKGLATEATKAVIDYGIHKIKFHKIQICHMDGNISSQKVIEKCNFNYEGTLRDFFFIDNKYCDKLIYSLIPSKTICNNLEEVRLNIDKTDNKIIKLISERQNYVVQASSFKKNTSHVKSPKRVESVIEKVRNLANCYGANEDLVENVYRTMINDFINLEMKEFKK